jgi:hypothetical protein
MRYGLPISMSFSCVAPVSFDAGTRLTHSAGLWRERRIEALAGRQTLIGRVCRLRCVSDFPDKNSCLKLQRSLTKTLRFIRNEGRILSGRH